MNRRTFLAMTFLGSLAACSPRATTPVDPVWGKQACAQCAMHVGDRTSAAQLVTHDGERLHFDDLGCMMAYLHERSPRVARSWVRAPGGQGWVDARTARYRGGAPTPMDYGFIAADGDGLPYEAVEARVAARLAGDDGEETKR